MDRVSCVRIVNVRAIASIELDLHSLTVAIGENGTGKSTIVECLELLRKAAVESNFVETLYRIHRGLPALLRKGTQHLELGLTSEDVAGQEPDVEYSFSLLKQDLGAVIEKEQLVVKASESGEELVVLERDLTSVMLYDTSGTAPEKKSMKSPSPGVLELSLHARRPPHRAVERMLRALRGIEVHLPFDTRAAWVVNTYQFSHSMRESAAFLPATRLELLGFNLASAWAALRNQSQAEWEGTITLLRLGLGDVVDTINIHPEPSGGRVSLSLKMVGLDEPLFASDLSDGQLAWLAFVAIACLRRERSLFVVDEPELHLHPSLLGRVMSLLSESSEQAPVLLCTHSERILELLEEPAKSLRVCRFNTQGKVVLSKLDARSLPKWLEAFGDLGELRASGYLTKALVDLPDSSSVLALQVKRPPNSEGAEGRCDV